MYTLVKTVQGNYLLLKGNPDKPEQMRVEQCLKMIQDPRVHRRRYQVYPEKSNKIIAQSEDRDELITIATMEVL